MADNPALTLVFNDACNDCGKRLVNLPRVLPEVGDDFDWQVRDYDGFRLFMLEELVARFPERKRWTPADLEVVIVEILASILDQLSDMADRVTSEAYLESARKPESVRRLLKMIGYDIVDLLKDQSLAPFNKPSPVGSDLTDDQRLEQFWLDHPEKMQQAKILGPRNIHTQHRMVTLNDYVIRLQEHPLVLRAHAWETWGGSWSVINLAIIGWNRRGLDEADNSYPVEVWNAVTRFHQQRDLFVPDNASHPSIRTVLRHYLEAYRMAGQQVQLMSANEVGILLSLSIEVNANYFQSEVRQAIEQALSTEPGGFFEPGRLKFGEDLWAGDIFETLMSLDGVDNVCINRFKRVGDRFPDMSGPGQIVLEGLEIAVCDNNPKDPAKGYYFLRLHGGRKG